MTNGKPLLMDLPAGTHAWCRCGASRNHPWCDGSHKKDAEVAPVVFYQPVKAKVKICRCGKSGAPPFCDGSHEEGSS